MPLSAPLYAGILHNSISALCCCILLHSKHGRPLTPRPQLLGKAKGRGCFRKGVCITGKLFPVPLDRSLCTVCLMFERGCIPINQLPVVGFSATDCTTSQAGHGFYCCHHLECKPCARHGCKATSYFCSSRAQKGCSEQGCVPTGSFSQ